MLKMTYPFAPPPLPFPYEALEPYISAETLHYHHDKHFKGYSDKLNSAIEKFPELKGLTLETLLSCPRRIPSSLRQDICHNAGGFYNHGVYFSLLSPPDSACNSPRGKFLGIIERTWGSIEEFKSFFSKKASETFGSGWTILGINKWGDFEIINLKNQQTPVPLAIKPLICLDLWEHAYYLDYKNLRADYINNFWHVISFPRDL